MYRAHTFHSTDTGAIAGGTVSVVLLMVGGGISISIVVIVMFKCFCKKNEDVSDSELTHILCKCSFLQ